MVVLTTMAAFLYGSRRIQLKNMARSLQLRYDAQVDCPLTQEAAKHIRLFNQGLAQFSHVLTWSEPGAFVRTSDTCVFTSPLDKSPQQTYTLVSAELTRGNFMPFVLMPRMDNSAPSHVALPPELALRYMLLAPENFRFPAGVLGLLKACKPCYLEATDSALVYHEYRVLEVNEIQPVRFRVKQFIQELRGNPDSSEPAVLHPFAQKTDAELQAEVLLKLKSGSTVATPGGNSRLIYGFILLVFLIGMCGLAWFALQQVTAR